MSYLSILPPSLPIAIGTSPTGEGGHFPRGGNKKGGKNINTYMLII
jgi:hypothetical protein